MNDSLDSQLSKSHQESKEQKNVNSQLKTTNWLHISKSYSLADEMPD